MKVNILGSNNISNSTVAIGTGIYDDLHLQWMLNLIKHLCANFVEFSERYFCTDTKYKGTAVIIDNSPGNGMLIPLLRNWLTDLGPEIGKFLYVCTLDSRDLEEVLLDIKNCSILYEKKLKTRKFIALDGKNLSRDTDKKDMDDTFYGRFIDYNWRKENGGDYSSNYEYFFIGGALKHFYDTEDKESRGEITNIYDNKEKEININRYAALIINKVPYDLLVEGKINSNNGIF